MKILSSFSVIALIFLTQSMLLAQNVSPQFSELNGIEDEQGNTHLLYRIYSYEGNPIYNSGSNNIYNLVPETLTDTVFLYDGFNCYPLGGSGISVSSYDIWNKDLTKHIYCGMESSCFEGWGYIARYDSGKVRNYLFESYSNLNISRQNDSLVYCAYPILKSIDGGFNWDIVTDSLAFLSLSPFNDQIYFSNGPFYWWGGSYLYKTSDGGNTFSPVDTVGNSSFAFYYDSDGSHIYRIDLWSGSSVSLKRSSNQGNAFTWQNIYSTNNNFYLTLDESQSGTIYLADGKRIFRSSDYGDTFIPYKELENRIIGIYKKHNSSKLYAVTKYNIYEITNDSISIIKSLPIPEELLAYYPLSVGNYWIYKVSDWSYPYYSEDTFTKKIISKETLSNNIEYFKIEEKYHGSSYSYFVYERVDLVNGLVYRFDNDCPNPDSEKVIDNFTADVGDSLLIQRYTMCWDSILTLFSAEGSENIFNENRNYRSFEYNWLMGYTHKLAQEIGIYYIRSGYDFGETNYTLNGCVLNDIVYGDTTLTDVADENELPKEFSLQQNYPNPFNPSTIISWQSPVSGYQTLKVFDVLGNEVSTLVDEYRLAGSYNVEFTMGNLQLSSGIYFYQLKAGDFIETRKMLLLK